MYLVIIHWVPFLEVCLYYCQYYLILCNSSGNHSISLATRQRLIGPRSSMQNVLSLYNRVSVNCVVPLSLSVLFLDSVMPGRAWFLLIKLTKCHRSSVFLMSFTALLILNIQNSITVQKSFDLLYRYNLL